jgi:hypothetical protein
MHAEISFEGTDEDGDPCCTRVILATDEPYQPSIAADLLDKVRSTYNALLPVDSEEETE